MIIEGYTRNDFSQQGPLLLKWFNVNLSMDEQSHAQ